MCGDGLSVQGHCTAWSGLLRVHEGLLRLLKGLHTRGLLRVHAAQAVQGAAQAAQGCTPWLTGCSGSARGGSGCTGAGAVQPAGCP